jgi:hypothetical protein
MGILEWLIPNQRFDQEVAEWKRSGSFPEEVVRLYQSDRARHKDFVRMTKAGFRVTHQEKVEANSMRDGDRSSGVQVTYSRNSLK